ncbi:LysE family transporter [uncultured Parasutterella sp.]|uniref:LysE family transporter n=1 Tax=uncultured Parasutterella sp. TaxID=1263098 RepID=UPI00272C8DE5|nr:LysE family transporter [uncultured Parasutterella sp.]
MFPWASFLLYTFVTSITPGPNNIMSMSLGLRVGFKKTLFFNAGVLTGFCIITNLCAFFCAKLNELIPGIMTPMLVLGTLYLLWLAWKICQATYNTNAVEPKKGQAYFSGLFLQFVNVKVFVSAIMSLQMFVLPYYQSWEALVFFATFIAICGTSCNLVWSGFGSIAASLFAKYTKLINTVLAVSLIFCAVCLWI